VDLGLGWWTVLVAVVVVVAGFWAALAVAARRLPPGVLRECVALLPNLAKLANRLRRDGAVPRRAKVALAVAAAWVVSPIDLVPEFLPVIGPLDDVVVVALVLRYVARTVPYETLAAAWDGDPRTLARLVGRRPHE
jgi:uncharacterized membrane protein YkvA (DUF1232 family)